MTQKMKVAKSQVRVEIRSLETEIAKGIQSLHALRRAAGIRKVSAPVLSIINEGVLENVFSHGALRTKHAVPVRDGKTAVSTTTVKGYTTIAFAVHVCDVPTQNVRHYNKAKASKNVSKYDAQRISLCTALIADAQTIFGEVHCCKTTDSDYDYSMLDTLGYVVCRVHVKTAVYKATVR